jgi:glycolate oxidase iron-sulfur subunit
MRASSVDLRPEDILIGPRAEDLARCVHCGFCLQACPTYQVLGLETESPRGRIQLARALSEGRIEPTPNVVQHFDLCLACRACETACPSGVPYGRIIEGARSLVQSRDDRPRSWRIRSRIARLVLSRPRLLKAGFTLLRLYQRTPLAPLVHRLLPGKLRRIEELAPRLPQRFFEPGAVAADPKPARATVALLSGCVMPYTAASTHEATVRVLARNGCRVLVPPAAGCCGAIHVHNGDLEAARELARRNIDAFLASGADHVIVNAGGCGSTMKEYGELLEHDRRYAAKAAELASRVRDVSEYLAALPFEPPAGRVDARVTYQDSCHVAHAQKIREAPRQILRSIPGLELVEMASSDRCCGSAGTYKLAQMDMSRELLRMKMDDALATRCDVIATANPDCMLQLNLGVRLHGGREEVVHVVELLDRAYGKEVTSNT